MRELKVGLTVTYFAGSDESKKLPNGMTSAPAIITQVFGEGNDVKHANLVVFTANPTGDPVRQEFSVMNQQHPTFYGNEGCPHFNW
jgi:hypothetical protein